MRPKKNNLSAQQIIQKTIAEENLRSPKLRPKTQKNGYFSTIAENKYKVLKLVYFLQGRRKILSY